MEGRSRRKEEGGRSRRKDEGGGRKENSTEILYSYIKPLVLETFLLPPSSLLLPPPQPRGVGVKFVAKKVGFCRTT